MASEKQRRKLSRQPYVAKPGLVLDLQVGRQQFLDLADGTRVELTVDSVRGDRVKLRTLAPPSVVIHRGQSRFEERRQALLETTPPERPAA